jgi:hypothetical protein
MIIGQITKLFDIPIKKSACADIKSQKAILLVRSYYLPDVCEALLIYHKIIFFVKIGQKLLLKQGTRTPSG